MKPIAALNQGHVKPDIVKTTHNSISCLKGIMW